MEEAAMHDNLTTGAPCRVGVDLVVVDDVARSLDRFGDRYRRRLFTEGEQAVCGDAPERLAARFAAKEAVLKVLRPTGARPPWTDIEVVSNGDGSTDVALAGAAQALADGAGVTALSVSLTHEGGLAAAVAVATMTHRGDHDA